MVMNCFVFVLDLPTVRNYFVVVVIVVDSAVLDSPTVGKNYFAVFVLDLPTVKNYFVVVGLPTLLGFVVAVEIEWPNLAAFADLANYYFSPKQESMPAVVGVVGVVGVVVDFEDFANWIDQN